jgi:hypothetical protein
VNQQLMEEKLERRAIKEGWPITAEMKQKILEKTYARATCGIPDIEEHATKSIVAMDKRNQELRTEEQRRIEAEHARKLQLLELAVKIGIVGDDGRAVGNSASVSSAGKIG